MSTAPDASPTQPRPGTSSGPWRPVVPEDLRPLVLGILHNISHTLPQADDPGMGANIAGGKAGVALFHAYHTRAGLPGGGCHHPDGLAHLEAAVEGLQQLTDMPHFYGGYSGVAWAVEHFQALGLVDDEDLNEDIDTALMRAMDAPLERQLCELIVGLAGYGTYAVERSRRPGAGMAVISRVVELLEATAVRTPEGLAWFHTPENLGDYALKTTPEGCYNAGLAHGIPGALVFLAEAHALGEPRAMALLESGMAWLLAQKQDFPNGSCFPYNVRPDGPPIGSRLAWCYGDLGVAAALYLVARKTGRADWEAEALSVAHACARREFAGSGVVDAGLCHGAIGNAHIFNRLYQASGDPLLLEATHKWLRQGLEMHKPGVPMGGFLAYLPPLAHEEDRDPWIPTPGLLEGSAGIGLALLAMVSDQEPAWDRFMLLNVPPKEA